MTIDMARSLFNLKEVSCETNPNHLTVEVAGKLHSRVQRLSVGVQSFDDGLLLQMKRLQKFGSGQQILDHIQAFAGEFQTFNIDMIFNFPNQTIESLKRDIEKVVESRTDQVCFYPLMTAPSVSDSLTGSLGKVDYLREVDFYHRITQDMSRDFSLTSAWTFSRKHSGMIDEYIIDYQEYVGVGSGAFSYLDGALYANTFSPASYEKKVDLGELKVSSIRQFDKLQQMRYRFMMELFGLRLDKQAFKRDFGISVDLGLFPEMTFLQLSGAFAVNDEQSISLTPKGCYLLVVMMREFFSQVDYLREQGRRSLSTEERSVFLGTYGSPSISPKDKFKNEMVKPIKLTQNE